MMDLLAMGSSPWWGPLFMFLIAAAIGLGAILVGIVFRPRNPSKDKLDAYECGNRPVGDTHERTPIRYYSVAMLFLLFDAEALFLWPWAVRYSSEGMFFLTEAFIFIAIVGAGYVYAWRKGAFEWLSR